MSEIAKRLNAYFEAHPFLSEEGEFTSVLEQLYEIYAETHESDPPEITDGFRQLEELLLAQPTGYSRPYWMTLSQREMPSLWNPSPF